VFVLQLYHTAAPWFFLVSVHLFDLKKLPLSSKLEAVMKQKTRIVMALFLGLMIVGGGWALPFWCVFIGDYDWYKYVARYDDKLLFVDSIFEKYRILPDSYYYVDSDGYSHFKLDEKSGYDESRDIIVIPGALDHFAFIYRSEILTDKDSEWGRYDDEYFLRDITEISSSPFLKETIGGKNIKYEPENLFRRFVPLQALESKQEYWNATCVPWVEGEAGAGIGANITISFKQPIRVISLLNGYVDIEKKYLYRQNNRVAVLKVVDMDNNKEYEMKFEDMVYYNSLKFENETRNIKMVIVSVYSGTRYDDTCITQIIYYSGDADSRIRYFEGVLEEYKKLNPNESSFPVTE
jgi:hypothetical protein